MYIYIYILNTNNNIKIAVNKLNIVSIQKCINTIM